MTAAPARPLILATEARGSGLGRFTVELADALEGAGVAVRLAAPAQPEPARVSASDVLPDRRGGGRIARLLALARQSLDLARVVARRAGQGRPMLMVHIHPTLPMSLLPLLAARRRGARTALSLHDVYPHTPRFPAALVPLEHAIYRWAYRRFDLILTNNARQSDRLAQEAGVARSRIVTLFHGAFAVPGVRPPAIDTPETTLLVFGSLRPNKRILDSIEAIRLLRAEGHAVRLRIAGAIRREDAEYWDACRAAIPAEGDGFDLRIGFVDDADLGEVYSGVDAFLCPYADFDSQSGVSISAASNGVPLIATPAAAAPTMAAGDPAWGPIDPAADGPAIADAIRRFLAVPRATRQAAAADLARRMLAETGWPRLGLLYRDALERAGFWR